MFRIFSKIEFTIVSVLFLAVFCLNVFSFHSAALGAVLAFVFFALCGNKLGRVIAPTESKIIRLLSGTWLLLSAIMILGSAAYYVYAVTQTVVVVLVLLALPAVWWLAWRAKREPVHDLVAGAPHRAPWEVGAAATAIVILLAIAANLLLRAATQDAVRSAWELADPSVFLVIGLAAFLLSALLYRGRERAMAIALTAATLFVFLSVAFCVFPLGYGFDTFIHKATESHIAAFGTITPKPFYYIGQYAVVLFLNLGFFLPLDLVDTLLVPVLTALFLPLMWYIAAAHLVKEKRDALASLGLLFLLPLGSFIVTTPQGLANLWTLLLILYAVPRLAGHDGWPLWPAALSALAAVLIHPIAGIPAMLFLALLAADPRHPRQKYPKAARAFTWFIIAVGSVLLPLTFVANSILSRAALKINFASLAPQNLFSSLHLDIFFENRFSPVLDFAYLFAYNQVLLLILCAALGFLLCRAALRRSLSPALAVAAMLVVNYAVMKSAVEFTFLIDYERSNYADRLIPLALFFLVPFLIVFSGKLTGLLRARPVVLRVFFIVLLAALITSSFYLTYPRRDNYETSHGFNLGAADVSAVWDADRDASGADYVVLANQTVASAAIREFGFTRYYDDVFYYPVPTGGPLYQLFLDMNDHPNLETAGQAMDLAGVDRLYFLVNDYWWQSDRIVEVAKTNADEWWSVGNGAVHIFKYVR